MAIGYATWWFLPVGSPALLVYFALLGAILKIVQSLRKRRRKDGHNKEILRTNIQV